MDFQTFSACGELYYSFNHYYIVFLKISACSGLWCSFSYVHIPYFEICPPAAGYSAYFPTDTYNLLKISGCGGLLWYHSFMCWKSAPPLEFCTPSEILLWIRPCGKPLYIVILVVFLVSWIYNIHHLLCCVYLYSVYGSLCYGCFIYVTVTSYINLLSDIEHLKIP